MSRAYKVIIALVLCVVFVAFLHYGGNTADAASAARCAKVLAHARSSTDTLLVITSRRWSYCAMRFPERAP